MTQSPDRQSLLTINPALRPRRANRAARQITKSKKTKFFSLAPHQKPRSPKKRCAPRHFCAQREGIYRRRFSMRTDSPQNTPKRSPSPRAPSTSRFTFHVSRSRKCPTMSHMHMSDMRRATAPPLRVFAPSRSLLPTIIAQPPPTPLPKTSHFFPLFKTHRTNSYPIFLGRLIPKPTQRATVPAASGFVEASPITVLP